MKGVEVLNLSLFGMIPPINDDTLIKLIECCPKLRELELRHSGISNNSFIQLGKLNFLEKLSVGDCMKLKFQNLLILNTSCPKLNSLEISYWEINPQLIGQLEPLWKRLTSLYLRKCPKLDDSCLTTWSLYLENLKTADFSHTLISFHGIKFLCRKCPKLEYLELRYLSLYPKFLAELIEEYPQVSVKKSKIFQIYSVVLIW